MTANLAAAINATNFYNPSDEQREYYMDYLNQWELKADSMPPDHIVSYLANALYSLRNKICFERFGIGSDNSGTWHDPEHMAMATAKIIEEIAGHKALDGHRQPIEEQILALILESTKVGPRNTHVNTWKKFTSNADSHFHQYLKNLPIETWRIILSHFKKDFQPVEGEDRHDFQSKLKRGFGDIVETSKQSPHWSLLQTDLAYLYIFYQTNQIGKNKEIQSSMEDLASEIYRLMDRKPYMVISDVEFYRRSMSTFVSIMSNASDSDPKCVDVVKEQLSNMIDSIKTNDLFAELYLDILDLIKKMCLKTTGPDPHLIVDKMASYWGNIKPDNIKDKNGIFLNVATTFAEFLESLEDGGYLKTLLRAILCNFLTKLTKNTTEHQNLWIRLLTAAIQFDGHECNYAIDRSLRDIAKFVKWKDYKKDCKFILEEICRKRIYKAVGSREARDEGSQLDDLFETFLKELSKAKIINLYVDIIADHVLDIIEERAIPLFESVQTGARSLMDVITIKEHRMVIFDSFVRLTDILKIEDYPWTIYYSQRGLAELGNHCIKGLGTGKDLSESEIKILIDFTTTVLQGDFIDPDENRPGGVFYDLYSHIGGILKLLADKDELRKNPLLIELFLQTLTHDEDDICERGAMIFNDIGAKAAPALAQYLGVILEAFLDKQQSSLLYHLPLIYNENPEALKDYFQRLIDLVEDADSSIVTSIYMLLTAIAKKQPMLFTEANVEMIVDNLYSGDPQYSSYGITTLEPLASKRSALFLKQVDKFITKPFNEHYYYFLFKILGYIAARNGEKVAEKILTYFIEFTKTNSDNNKEMYIIQEIKGIAFKYKDLVNKQKSFIVNLRQKTSEMHVKDGCTAIIDFLEGRSLDSLKDELAAQQEDIDNLDVRVTSNEKNITIVTKEVKQQKVDITNIKQDVKGQGKKLDILGNVVKATVTKVEEIDLKTLSHAPYWSKDVSKLLNPKSEHDWRLLSSRLGYSKDDIRAWSQQADPCMAMLNEWYTTHKTSEANNGLLTALQEMDRMDAAILIENGMKASEQIVEDEEFDYATPPPIFLSYQWGHQEEVKLLRHHLEMAGYDCWMDIGQMGGGDKLFEKIDKGIRAAKIIISCTTEKYAESPNCNREVNLSVNLKKPIIPLLLENCPWPPKGSMGPIFSEYLYIQFYQTKNDEATPDDRFWPIPKFQELLMQLSMNGVQPDESRIFKLYRNWWKPLVDEVKIDKSKTFRGGKHKKVIESLEEKESDNLPTVFISYQWDKQKSVMKLYKKLTDLGYHCWMDIYQMGGGDSLYDKIDRGIRGCKVVVSCVTDKYSLSLNCRREIGLCDALKRSIIPLLFENISWPPKGPMSMTFSQLLYIDFHSNANVQEEWSGTKFDELHSKLREIFPDQTNETKKIQESKDTPKLEEVVITTKTTHLENPKPPPIPDETKDNQAEISMQIDSNHVKSSTPGSNFDGKAKVKRFVPPPPPIQSQVKHIRNAPAASPTLTDNQQMPHTQSSSFSTSNRFNEEMCHQQSRTQQSYNQMRNYQQYEQTEEYHQEIHSSNNNKYNNGSVQSKSCVIL